MRRVSQFIGWSQEAKLYYEWLMQLERLTAILGKNITPVSPGWTFVPDLNLDWPANTDGYTLYTDGFTNNDDGESNVSIPFAGTFNSNGISDTEYILSTNGYLYGVNSGQNIYGNSGDLYITPGDPLIDGDTQNFWYQNTVNGSKWKTSALVYCGRFGAQTTPYSYIINIYRDSQYQYIETRVKSNTTPFAISGPGSNGQLATTLSKVWQSPLDGSTWTYLGLGVVQ